MDSKIKIMGYAVLGLYFVGMLAIGYFCNKKYANNVDGFFAGGKNLGPWVFALTYGSTYLSSSTFVGNTATAYSGGLAYLFMPLAQMLLLPLGLIFFSHILRKMSQSLDVVTIPAYLEKRFKSPAAGMITSLIIVIFFIPYLVGIVKASALSLGALLGVEYKIGVLVIAFISFIYLMFGGYMARCYTDVVQGVMMVVGMMAVVIAGFFIVGGPSAITEGVKAADPALLETPGPKGWSALFLYSTVFAIAPWGLPTLVQTNFTIGNRKHVYTAAIVLSIWISCVLFGSMIIGNMGRAFYGNALVDNPDSLFPTLVMDWFPNLFGAIIIVAVICAAMSTIDGTLMNSGAAVGLDIYKRFIKKDASDKKVITVSNIAMGIITLVVIIWAFDPPAMVLTLTSYAFSLVAAGLIVPTYAGLYCKKLTSAGCVVSILAGLGFCLLWYVTGTPLGIPPFVVGMVASAIALFGVSKFTKPLPQEFIDDLFAKLKNNAYVTETVEK